MIETIPVVILAGGQGVRMGGGKPDQRLAGVTLLDHAIAKAAKYSSTLAISVGQGTRLSSGDYAVIQDEGDVQGPIAGLAAALKFASEVGASHAMIMPCDTPFMPDDLLPLLYDARGQARAALAQCAGQLHAACSLWSVEATDLLPEYLAQGRRSLIGIAENAGYVAVKWPEADADRFMNINTASDLLQAERMFAEMG